MPVMLSSRCVWLFLLMALAVSVPSTAEAKLPRGIKIGDHTMALNGEGTRTKAFVSIYETGLYLLRPSSNATEILAADQMMAIRVRITSSFVSQSSLVSSLQDGLKKSTGGNTAAIKKETQLFLKYLKDDVNKNDTFDFVYFPQKGTYIIKNGKMQGNIPGLAFKKAFFGIWLSDKPVDKNLRSAMLRASATR